MADHKHVAVDFLRRATAGDVDEAFRLHIGPGFRHHNPYFPNVAADFKREMAQHAEQFPLKTIEFHQVLSDGDKVVVLAHVKFTPDDRGWALVTILRFEGDAIVELWDVGQQVPEQAINELGMF